MRRISILFIVLAIVSISSAPSHAQRYLGAGGLALDDGLGHVVNITIPSMTGPGPYSWVLPVTPGGTSMLPSGTTNNSILRWNAATSTWQEDIKFTVTSAGAVSLAHRINLGSIFRATLAQREISKQVQHFNTPAAVGSRD